MTWRRKAPGEGHPDIESGTSTVSWDDAGHEMRDRIRLKSYAERQFRYPAGFVTHFFWAHPPGRMPISKLLAAAPRLVYNPPLPDDLPPAMAEYLRHSPEAMAAFNAGRNSHRREVRQRMDRSIAAVYGGW